MASPASLGPMPVNGIAALDYHDRRLDVTFKPEIKSIPACQTPRAQRPERRDRQQYRQVDHQERPMKAEPHQHLGRILGRAHSSAKKPC